MAGGGGGWLLQSFCRTRGHEKLGIRTFLFKIDEICRGTTWGQENNFSAIKFDFVSTIPVPGVNVGIGTSFPHIKLSTV